MRPRCQRRRRQSRSSTESTIKTSAAALARTMLIDDERVTFVEGTVRRSIGKALVEVGAARESGGGTAARAQVLGQIGSVNLNAEAIVANDFHLRAATREPA